MSIFVQASSTKPAIQTQKFAQKKPSNLSLNPANPFQDAHHALQLKQGTNPFPSFSSFQSAGQASTSPSLLQAKLSIGQPNDHYEQEADRMAEQVVKGSPTVQRKGSDGQSPASLASQVSPLSASFAQRKCADCAAEESLQTKLVQRKGGLGQANNQLESQINRHKGGGNPMDASTQSFMSQGFGADFSGVRIHTGSQSIQMNQELGAKAFTVGNDIHFNRGQYQPGSSEGKQLLAHELTHTIQQGSGALQTKSQRSRTNIIQRYIEATGSGSSAGNSYRVADDLSATVRVGYPNHYLYAKAGKAAQSNTKLKAVGSGIELVEESNTITLSKGAEKKTLKKVSPKNLQNKTEGDDMKLWADCGKSAGVIVGGTNRGAVYRDASTGKIVISSASSPSLMKAEVIEKLLRKWLTMPSTTDPQKVKIQAVLDSATAKKAEADQALSDYSKAKTKAEKKTTIDRYWAKVSAYGEIMMSYYNTLSESFRNQVDEYLKINKYANPEVGQGYTMSSGGADYTTNAAGDAVSTWNFHWGGVVMKSDDQKDNITLENYAVGDASVENKDWDFAMYGTDTSKKGQTFHEQHHDTHQHGKTPTTMTVQEK